MLCARSNTQRYMNRLSEFLQASASLHSHLCPRQVLGVRIVLAAAKHLGLEVPRKDKRLLAIIETDGCFVDGVAVAGGISVGRRTIRIEDYGKVAATFIDTQTGKAVRLAPQEGVREKAIDYSSDKRHYFAQLDAYQQMPDEELFTIQQVHLKIPIEVIISRPGVRATCQQCGEEILNEREVTRDGVTLCRACAGQAYYTCLD